MKSLEWIREKVNNGRFQDLAKECLWVWQYVRRYRLVVALHIFLGILGILMSLGSSVASKFLIDAVIGYNSSRIGIAAAMMLGMQLGSIAMRAISAPISASVNVRVQNDIQGEIYRRILSTDWQSLEHYRSGDLLNRLGSDASAVSSGVTGFIPALISGSVQFLGAFLIMLSRDTVMALIALIGLPLTAVFSRLLVRRMRLHNREMKEVHSDMMAFQEDSLRNITSIKAFGVAEKFGDQMQRLHQRYRQKHLSYSRFSAHTSAFMSLLSLLAYAGCFGWGVYRLWTKDISYGDMTMFLQLSSMLGTAFSSLVSLVPTAVSISTSAGRIMAVVQLPAEDATPQEGFGEEESFTVSLSQVDFSYQGGAPVLRQADFTARPEELVSITGPSGEGKTTLLRILLGLVTPSRGEACLTGSSGKHYPLGAATRRTFGYVPQGNQVFTGTIEENLRLVAPNATEDELIQALKIACAYDFVMELPEGLQHVVGGRDKRLSEGQAQRLGIARALLRKAPVLLLDEATSALDSETEEQLLKNLMASGLVHTCILVTHRPACRKYCTRSYTIRDGVIREEAAL